MVNVPFVSHMDMNFQLVANLNGGLFQIGMEGELVRLEVVMVNSVFPYMCRQPSSKWKCREREPKALTNLSSISRHTGPWEELVG